MLVRLSAALAAICMLSGAAIAQGAAKPTDPQIAHIAYTAGQLDITAAKQALSKSKNKDVLAFAEDMVRDPPLRNSPKCCNASSRKRPAVPHRR